ncbi:Zinc finger protein, partial [Thalictrum thalictroides]
MVIVEAFGFRVIIGKIDVDISLFRSVGCGSSNLSCDVSSSSGLSLAVCGSSDISSVASTSLGLTVVGSSHEVRKSLTWGLAITGIGQRFSSKKDFVDALLRYSIEKGFKYTKIKNDTTRFTACCSLKQLDGCKWYIRASAIQGIESFFVVKKFVSEHNCGKLVKDNYKPKMSRELVMKSIIGHVQDKPSLKPKEIIDEMRRVYGVSVNYYYARVGKKLVVEKIFGDEAHSYSLLHSYMNTMKERDP